MDYLTVDIMVWVLFSAVLIGVLYTAVMQNILSGFAKRLIEKGAKDESSALDMKGLGYKSSVVMMLADFFANGGTRIAKAIGKVTEPQNEKAAVSSELLFKEKTYETRYYINCQSDTDKLERHINERITLPKLAFIIILLAAMAFAAPYVIRFVQNNVLTDYENSEEVAVGVEKDNKSLLEEQQEATRLEDEQKAKEEALKELEEQAKAQEDALKQQNDPLAG